jgi:hypothetical protein
MKEITKVFDLGDPGVVIRIKRSGAMLLGLRPVHNNRHPDHRSSDDTFSAVSVPLLMRGN